MRSMGGPGDQFAPSKYQVSVPPFPPATKTSCSTGSYVMPKNTLALMPWGGLGPLDHCAPSKSQVSRYGTAPEPPNRTILWMASS